jgi:hypothetical protein
MAHCPSKIAPSSTTSFDARMSPRMTDLFSRTSFSVAISVPWTLPARAMFAAETVPSTTPVPPTVTLAFAVTSPITLPSTRMLPSVLTFPSIVVPAPTRLNVPLLCCLSDNAI